MRYGAVNEEARDLNVPGPLGGWKFRRSYNSMTDIRNALTTQGNGWLNNQTELLLVSVDSTHVAVNEAAASRVTFTLQGSTYVPPNTVDWSMEHDTTNSQFVVTNNRSGVVWVFHDFSTGDKSGRLKESTTRWWRGAGKIGATYSYVGRRMNQITTPEGQEYNIAFTYRADGQITAIAVDDGTTVFMKAEYTYFDSTAHSTDIGSAGDLVQVKVTRLTSDGTDITNSAHRVERYTQYRYDQASRLTGIFNHDGLISLVADHGLSSPDQVLTKGNNDTTGSAGGHKVVDFADRLYTEYYTSPTLTSSVTTAFGAENLETMYGGINTDESGMVKTGIDRPNGCSSCGTGSAGIKYEYYYMTINHGSSPGWNDVVWLTIEDVTDSNGVPLNRRVWGLNDMGRDLRHVIIEKPVAAPKYWCDSQEFVNTASTGVPAQEGRLAEKRQPSAHTIVDTASELREFLDPSGTTSSQSNDSRTLNDSDGMIGTFDYDSEGRRIATKLKKGETGTAYYTSYVEYDTSAGVDLPAKIYSYPTAVSSSPTTNGAYTEYTYTFHDTTAKTRMKTRRIALPVVSTAQNGSGIPTYLWEYYDEAGRIRWTKNGEGYVTYRAYHPYFGSLAYQMRDVDTASLDTAITSGSAGKWEAWSGAVPTDLARTSGLPTALALVTKQEFDDEGRNTLRINPGGDRHFNRYEQDKTLYFPYVDASSGLPLLPVQVTKWDSAHRNTENYAVAPSAATASGGLPTGISTTQADYVAWTRNHYDSITGELTQIDRYHVIPGSGTGSLGTNFASTSFLYDGMGHRGAIINYVDTNKYQVTTTIFDSQERPIETRRGVATTAPDDYGDLDNDIATTPSGFNGYAIASKVEYDGNGVGDGHVTRVDRFFGTGSSDYTKVDYSYTWRGHLRSERPRTSSNGTILNYPTMSLDWMGRPVASAIYTNSSTWLTVLAADDGYGTAVADNSSNRNELTKTYYNALGQVYRMERFPGTETTNHFEINNYYDRNARLVATGEKNAVHTETAYDGASRQYQQRTVVKLENDDATYGKYTSSGAFNYVEPAPHPSLSSMDTTGDDGVIELAHTVYDAAGNATEQHTFEVNSSDTNGIDIDSTTSYIRRSVFSYYDGANRLTTTADYGSGDGTATPTTWSYTARPARSSEPGWTTSTVYNGYVLLAKYGYDASTGLVNTVTTGVSQSGSDTNTVTTKTFYDALGSSTAVAENWVNYVASADTGAGGGTNNVEDRVTKFSYNGLGQQSKLTAVNATSSGTVNQETKYYYEDAYNAALLTHTTYPDSSSTPTSGTDLAKLEHNLDGSLKKKTDQRGVEITYAYDDARRLKAEQVTSFGSSGVVDNLVQSITRKYDDLGRPVKLTSHGNATDDPDNTTTIRNQLVYTIGSLGLVTKTEQSHSGAVTTGTPAVQYAYDDTVSSNVYTNNLRQKKVTYPGGRVIHSTFGSSGSVADVLNRLDMYEADSSGSPGYDLVIYKYNGTSRVAKTDYTDNDLDAAIRSEHGWDRFGRTVTQRWYQYHGGAGVIDQVDYTYDYAGNRLTRNVRVDLVDGSYGDNRDQKYTYDGLQRLSNTLGGTYNTGTGAIDSRNFEQDWTLDQLGNWPTFKERDTDTGSTWDLDQSRTHNAANELTHINVASTYVAEDAAGNMTKIPKPTSWSAAFDLKYDAWNRLVEVKDGGTTVQTNKFDGLGRRIQRVAGSDTYDYYYNEEWQLLEERKNSDADPLNQYLWHPYYIDALALRWYDADTNPGTGVADYYYLQDANYNVTAVTDHNGNVVERYAYSPYGKVTVLDPNFAPDSNETTDIGNTHFYTGRELDAETGLQLNRHRFYSSWLGRWGTRDPIGYRSGTNLYGYVDGRPLVFYDPEGLQNWLPPANFMKKPDDDECCNDAKKAGDDKGHIGGVICCNGRKVTCAWKSSATGIKDPRTANISKYCVHEHENTHKEDIDECDCNKPLYRPPFKKGKDQNTEECLAYKEHVKCLKYSKAVCNGDAACEAAINAEMKAREAQRDSWCKRAGLPVP